MIIFNVSAKAEHGKDTFYEIVNNYYDKKDIKVCHMLFAKHLKQYAKDYFGWDGKEETKPRELLQTIGTNVIRDKMNNPNFHANRLIEDIQILSNYFDVFVITDCRFPNEVELVKNAFNDKVKSIRIERPNHKSRLTKEQLLHKSETSLDDYNNWDYKIINDGTLENFKGKVYNIVDKVGE